MSKVSHLLTVRVRFHIPLLYISIDSPECSFQQHAERLVTNHVTRVFAIFMNERVASIVLTRTKA